MTLQRKSHLLEDEKRDKYNAIAGQDQDAPPYRPAYRRRRWQIGMGLFVISNLVGSTIQITTLPLPVLSTLQASGLVFNTVCASIVLHEAFTRWSFIGTALVAGGALLIALFGALAEPSHTLAQLLVLLGRKQFLLWMFGTFLIIAFVLLGMFVLDRIHPHSHTRGLRVARGFAFGGISAILSAHSLLVAKSAVELLVRTIVDKVNQFNRWESWLILLALVFFALSQLYFLHRGLKLVSTSILYPFVFCVYNIIAILDGLIYFDQSSRISPLHSGLIALGTFVLLSGVLALSWRRDEDYDAAPPADVHTLLTPGMGLVEDTTTDEERDTDIDEDNASITSADEEATLAPSEVTPLLRNGRSRTSMNKARANGLHVSKPRKTFMDGTSNTNGFDGTTSTGTKPDLAPLSTHLSSPALLTTNKKGHKRIRSADLPPHSSQHSSPSPAPSPRPGIGLSRASTVHAQADFRGPVHSLTWRERDRDIRRRRWGRRSMTTGGSHFGPADRGRSASMPMAFNGRWRSRTDPVAGMGAADAGAGARSRLTSIGHWVGRIFSGGTSVPRQDHDTNGAPSRRSPTSNE